MTIVNNIIENDITKWKFVLCDNENLIRVHRYREITFVLIPHPKIRPIEGNKLIHASLTTFITIFCLKFHLYSGIIRICIRLVVAYLQFFCLLILTICGVKYLILVVINVIFVFSTIRLFIMVPGRAQNPLYWKKHN